MRRALMALAAVWLAAGPAIGYAAPLKDAFLENLVGTWVLRGTIAGRETTHDVVAEWILGHQYVRINERSREKDAKGAPQYDALVLIGWDASSSEYQCLWLDSTAGGGLSTHAIGRGRRVGDGIPFLFREPDGSVSFNNTFLFDQDSHSWAWQMDNVQNGKSIPFGRVRLTAR